MDHIYHNNIFIKINLVRISVRYEDKTNVSIYILDLKNNGPQLKKFAPF